MVCLDLRSPIGVRGDQHVRRDKGLRLAPEHFADILNDAAQRDNRRDADGNAQEEKQQALPRCSHLAHGHSKYEEHLSISDGLNDTTVPQPQASISHRGQLGIVGHEHDGGAASRVNLAQKLHDVPAVGGIEIAGWLVRENDRGIVGERAGKCDALLLTTRQLRRIVMRPACQADFFEQRFCPASAFLAPTISIGTDTFSSAVSDGIR